MTSILLDSHVVHWWLAEPERLSSEAVRALESADDLAVAAITWYELAWMANRDRILLTIPTRTWLDTMSAEILTIGITPAIAATAADLPSSFPGDPADRLIYATAVETGRRLVTKDSRMRDHPWPRPIAIW